jgi:3-deoxy-7-phosphoheptulonate synthase
MREEGLELLAWTGRETGMPVVTEVMDTRQVGLVSEHADILQVGSRSMHNYPLLEEVGQQSSKPVLLKRGMGATIEELLLAAEYILNKGNSQVMLCERGIRTFETATRNTLDLNAVPILKRMSHLPVIVDPSHGTGHWWMVPAMSKAAVAVGADGLLVEVHCNPQEALSDGPQSLHPDRFDEMMHELSAVARSVGRTVTTVSPTELAGSGGNRG